MQFQRNDSAVNWQMQNVASQIIRIVIDFRQSHRETEWVLLSIFKDEKIEGEKTTERQRKTVLESR